MLKSAKETAKAYGFSVSHIRKLICQGRLIAVKIGNFYGIDINNPKNLKGLKRRRKLNKDDYNGSNK